MKLLDRQDWACWALPINCLVVYLQLRCLSPYLNFNLASWFTYQLQVLTPLQPLDLLVVAALPGVAEELLFRGALIPAISPDWCANFQWAVHRMCCTWHSTAALLFQNILVEWTENNPHCPLLKMSSKNCQACSLHVMLCSLSYFGHIQGCCTGKQMPQDVLVKQLARQDSCFIFCRKGVAIAGATFGFLHNNGGRNPAFALWASLVGCAYGFLFITTQNLYTAMLAHSLANLASGVLWLQSNGAEEV